MVALAQSLVAKFTYFKKKQGMRSLTDKFTNVGKTSNNNSEMF